MVKGGTWRERPGAGSVTSTQTHEGKVVKIPETLFEGSVGEVDWRPADSEKKRLCWEETSVWTYNQRPWQHRGPSAGTAETVADAQRFHGMWLSSEEKQPSPTPSSFLERTRGSSPTCARGPGGLRRTRSELCQCQS